MPEGEIPVYHGHPNASIYPCSGEINVTDAVVKGEYLWKVRGMSWLLCALADNDETFVVTDFFKVGGHALDLVYSPKQDASLNHASQYGSLAIRHWDLCAVANT